MNTSRALLFLTFGMHEEEEAEEEEEEEEEGNSVVRRQNVQWTTSDELLSYHLINAYCCPCF